MQLTSTPDRGCISEHCVKSVQIQSFFWSLFPAFVLNTEYLSVFSPNAGKYGPEKTPYLDTFNAVEDFQIWKNILHPSTKRQYGGSRLLLLILISLFQISFICSSIRLIFQNYFFSGVGDLIIISSCFNLFLSLGLQGFFAGGFSGGFKGWKGDRGD